MCPLVVRQHCCALWYSSGAYPCLVEHGATVFYSTLTSIVCLSTGDRLFWLRVFKHWATRACPLPCLASRSLPMGNNIDEMKWWTKKYRREVKQRISRPFLSRSRLTRSTMRCGSAQSSRSESTPRSFAHWSARMRDPRPTRSIGSKGSPHVGNVGNPRTE